MNQGKAIIGKEIIGECVRHDEINNKDNILEGRPRRIRLKNRSKNRTGRFSEAYVEKEIIKVSSEKIYAINHSVSVISKLLEERYKIPFDVREKGTIKSNQLFGECSKLGRITILPAHASCHRGQRVPMQCNEFALCYTDPFKEPTYKKF